ncbi:hypothetical protein DESUT3_11800 [Desulfuromonas versatilis]|uniref:Uncharacterized protein n=1 Tax=Desulfuromonas versatilis TaxID=2802975 RepID=A0ABM8HQL6_9BACT|nr:hypothetical protein [Desulfuromonas versatilis]BCR04111.1 hypothetical protein DESUT3_11800 [Desulfuromonas versatilis]
MTGKGKPKRLKAVLWFGTLSGLFAGAVAMYAAWLLAGGEQVRSGAGIQWGSWLRIGALWALLVGGMVMLTAWALSGFYPPRE